MKLPGLSLIPTPYKILALVLLIISCCSTTAFFVHKYTVDEYQLKINAANLAATTAQGKLDVLKAVADTQLKDKTDEIKKEFDGKISGITADRDKYRNLFLTGSRLREHSNTPIGGGSTNNPTSGSGVDDGNQSGTLSSATSGALYNIASDADTDRTKLAACQKYAQSVSDTFESWKKQIQTQIKTEPQALTPAVPKKKTLLQ